MLVIPGGFTEVPGFLINSLSMKKIIVTIVLLAGLYVQAQQKNTLLDQGFWKSLPSLNEVKAEVAKGSSPSEYNPMKMDAATLAILGGAPTDVVAYLVEQPGNSMGKITHEGRTYLHWAAMKGNTEIVSLLLSKGADLNLEEEHGLTPAYLAVNNAGCTVAMVETFVKNGLDLKKKYKDNTTLLLVAIAADKDFSVTEYLIKKGLSVKDADANNNTAINYAARGGNTEGIKKLLKLGVKYNEQALIFAAQGTRRGANTVDVFKYLVDELKIKPGITTKEGDNVLHLISKKQNQEEAAAYFLNKGVSANQVNSEGDTPLIVAAGGKDIAVIQALLAKTKNINAVNSKGESALTQAVKSSTGEVVSYLISKGADVKVTDKKGNTLTYYLVDGYRAPRGGFGTGSGKDDFTDKLQLLKQNGLNPAAPQKDGNTLYHTAITKNSLDLLKKLSGYDININAQNTEGLTVLHKAAMTAKDDEILKYLVVNGAKKDIRTEMNESAFELAKENEFLQKNKISVDFLK